jgi:hypothetical protein
MLKLHVSESWIISNLAAAIRRERDSCESEGMRDNLESGELSTLAGWKGVVGESVAVGRRKEVRICGTDFVR